MSAVSSWSLGHNAAGRAHVLAQIHSGLAPVEIIGSLLSSHGSSIWRPLQESCIPVRSICPEHAEDFVSQALQLVAANPYHLVHLSKPRMPNIVLGLLYKLVWRSRVILDIDDEEMAFFPKTQAEANFNTFELLGKLPEIADLVGPEWTRIAIECRTLFDAVTVSNPVLQQRYGGTIVRHARSAVDLDPSLYPMAAMRRLYNIGEEERVVLFLGTPRAHKGLVETAAALDALAQPRVIFMIVGDFPRREEGLRHQLSAFTRLRFRFLPDQPFARLPNLLALADICLALQNPNSPISVSQVPAKLSDALAMGRLVIVSQNPALGDLTLGNNVLVTNWSDLDEVMASALSSLPESEEKREARRALFQKEFSLLVNRQRLGAVLSSLPAHPIRSFPHVMRRVFGHLPGVPRELVTLMNSCSDSERREWAVDWGDGSV